MSKVYFGKMNVSEQVINKQYITEEKKLLGDISIGDYAFIKLEKETSPATVKRLWKLIDIQQSEGSFIAYFDEICVFDPVQLYKFEALDLFVLDLNLLNKCNKPTKRLSFINLSLVNESLFEELIKTPTKFIEYVNDASHYRKIVKLDDKRQIQKNTINVQLYKENDAWKLFSTDFIGADLKDNYDSKQFDLYKAISSTEKRTIKKKMFDFLSGKQIDVPMIGLWDMFCGTVDETEKDFVNYCKNNGVEETPDKYVSGIRTVETKFNISIEEEYKQDKCKSIIRTIREKSKGLSSNKKRSYDNLISYINKYVKYKDSLQNSTYNYSKVSFSGINKVYYGTPGCGKSHYVEKTVLKNEGIEDANVFRTTFFYDYSNTDFIGQVLPRVNEDETVTYEFIPGPFTLALRSAIDNSNKKIALVIEELNRGNAPSIFGDIFQLLDRTNGTSRYEIINVNIIDYLKKNGTLKNTIYELDYIKIPSNMFIFATMNTSDQNVFTLDTAFKRRWKFEKRTNEFLDEETIGNKYVPGLINVTWSTFVKSINKHIIDYSTSLSAEDKQIGKYFVEEDILLDKTENDTPEKIEEFAYKVFEYLWTDVAKYNRTDWFIKEVKTLDGLIERYKNHEQIFISQLEQSMSDEGKS